MLHKFNRLLALSAALLSGVGLQADLPEGQKRTAPPTASGDQSAVVERATRRRMLVNARKAAAERARPAREAAMAARAAKGKDQAVLGARSANITFAPGTVAPPGVMNPLGTPDYMSGLVPNYANSPIIRKFVDTLPGLGPTHANNLGNYIPIAVANTSLFPGSDYYDIGLVDYTQQLHSDLPATHLRGYKDMNGVDGKAHYLGPVIIAQRDKPVRVTFRNLLPTGTAGNLLIPVDASLMGAGSGPGSSTFTQNRAELHLHGGLNPWISDGTPHQWITPAGDSTPNKKGASFANVPDMVGPGNLFPTPSDGDGIGTYFYTNQQSGRFMFYHDHSFGLTRLNVYMGEAAGYLIVDPVETKLIADGILPNNGGDVYNYGIPLVFQDKTFVPGPTDLAYQDPTWDTTNWGGYGDLWYPHVYMPNQNPGDPSGANAMGRWDYGPWFWPPVPVANAVNSIPTDHGPKPGINPGDPDFPGTPNPSLVPEGFMDTPLVNGTPYPKVTLEPKAYRFRLLNASNDRPFGLGFYYADPAHPTEVKMIPATPAEAAQGPLDANGAPLWPTDGRDGGVVDFRTAGPDIIQIGNESGFLPTPVVHHSQATTYNYNRRDIVVLDVANHGLFLAPAERADIIVDFSTVPSGSKLILYNDMLAPVPAFDVRYDYFTGDPDHSLTGDGTGGAPTTLEGYGPNTRTLMQVEIVGTPAGTFNMTALNAAFTSTSTSNGAFAATQHPPIVPQTFYNSAMNTNYTADTYSTIQANVLNFTKTENGLPVGNGVNGSGTGITLQPKAIQELFELDYGRMNATLGIELPFTNFNNQTTIPLGYSEPATEILTDGTTQLWKITHNGVDTHPVHFHLFDVQIVNRVGWDGAVRFPEANELGWKETVRMKPLEDIIVAFRPVSPKLPFSLLNSQRVIDPTKDTGAMISVTDLINAGPNQGNLGNQIPVANAVTDYGWEYVWHCHILGHEENDFMRPLVLNVATTAPAAPTGLVAAVAASTRINLTWTDVSTDETGFAVERSPQGANTFVKIGSTVPDQNNYSDFTAVNGTAYDYRVYAYNQAGPSAASASASATPSALAPATGLVVTPSVAGPTYTAGTPVVYTAVASGSSNYQYVFYLYDGVSWTQVQSYSPSNAWTLPASTPVGNYRLQVWVRTNPTVAYDQYSPIINFSVVPGAASAVSVTPSLPAPFAAGTPIKFTAVGQGASNYQYIFYLDNGSGWTITQNWSSTATWTMPGNTPAGNYRMQVWVRTTSGVAYDAYTSLSFQVVLSPATGVTVSPSLPGTVFGTNSGVVFNATGTGGSSSSYQYEFWLNDGTTWTAVQPYGPGASWTLPNGTPTGNYRLQVWVRTSSAVTYDAYTIPMTFTVN